MKLATPSKLPEAQRAVLRIDEMPPAVGVFFEQCVIHCGPNRALRWLQIGAGRPAIPYVTQGLIEGLKTAYSSAASQILLVDAMIIIRRKYLRSLKGWEEEKQVWTNQINRDRHWALKSLRLEEKTEKAGAASKRG